MSMSQKDYVMIAGVLASVRKDVSEEGTAVVNMVTSRLSAEFGKDNPRFNQKKFYAASRGETA